MALPIRHSLEPLKFSLRFFRSSFCIFDSADGHRPLNAFERHSIRVEKFIKNSPDTEP
jgi:hypothetical protein